MPVLKVTFNFLPAPITASVKYLVCEEAAASPVLIQPDFVTVAVALPVTLIPEVLVSLKVALLAVTLPPLVENVPAAIVNFAYFAISVSVTAPVAVYVPDAISADLITIEPEVIQPVPH